MNEFDQIVRRYQSPIRRFFLGQTLGNEALSDDLAQDTFIKAYTHWQQFRGDSQLLTWLMRIAYNVFYDYKRSEKARNERVSTGIPVGEGMAAANSSLFNLHSSLKMDIYQALAILKDEERTCISLQLIDGYPIDQISEITGIGGNTVKSHLKRGKEKLANYLRQNGYGK